MKSHVVEYYERDDVSQMKANKQATIMIQLTETEITNTNPIPLESSTIDLMPDK